MGPFDDFRFRPGDLVAFAIQQGRQPAYLCATGQVTSRSLIEDRDGCLRREYAVLFACGSQVGPWTANEHDLVPAPAPKGD